MFRNELAGRPSQKFCLWAFQTDRNLRFPAVRSPAVVTAQCDEFRSVFIARLHVLIQETQFLASILTDRLVQCICRNINREQGKQSLHSNKNYIYRCTAYSTCPHSLASHLVHLTPCEKLCSPCPQTSNTLASSIRQHQPHKALNLEGNCVD